jgi:predicted RNA-binding protein with PIN domain
MLLLVDAYNLLKTLTQTTFISSSEEALFVRQVAKYAALKQLTIYVVFDGGEQTWATDEHISDYVTTVRAGEYSSADHEIVRLTRRLLAKKPVVVTNDRALQAAVIAAGAQVVPVLVWWERVRTSGIAAAPGAVKNKGGALRRYVHEEGYQQADEVADALMQHSASKKLTPKVEEKAPTAREKSGYFLSKKDKQRQKLLKRL